MERHTAGIGYSMRSGDDFDFHQLAADLDEAGNTGTDFVELPLYQLHLIAGGRPVAAKLRQLRTICENRPFRYTAHGPLGINFLDVPERIAIHRDVLRAALEISGEIGARHYVLHGGLLDANDRDKLEDRFAQQRDILSEFAGQAAALGIIICVENLFTYHHAQIAALPSRLAQEIAAINHPHIAACLDFSHGFINASLHGADFMRETAALAPFAKHLHIHDSFGRVQNFQTFSRAERVAFGLGDLHLPIGWGAIPWDEIAATFDFPEGVVLNLELPSSYWSELENCIGSLRHLQGLIDERAEAASAAA